MPGGQMEPWSTLIEHSQVLKGEAVPAGSFFGGLPAHPLPPSYPWAVGLGGDDSLGVMSQRDVMAVRNNHEPPRPLASEGILRRLWPSALSASAQPSGWRLLDSLEAADGDVDDLPGSSSVQHPWPLHQQSGRSPVQDSGLNYVGFDVEDSDDDLSRRGRLGGGGGGCFSRVLGHWL